MSQVRAYIVTQLFQERIQDFRKGTSPAQLGGLGKRCKLPQRGLGFFLIISCSKHYIKLRAKTKIVYIFHESTNCWIYVLQSDA